MTVPSVALDADDLGPELALAALVEGVGGDEPARLHRPGREVVAAVVGHLRVDVEQLDAPRALAHRVADAVHAGVATADHDDVLVLGGDHVFGRDGAELASLHLGDGAVALVEVLHREVDAGELAAGDLDIALDPRAHRQHDRVELVTQFLDADVDADLDAAAEVDSLGGEDVGAAVDDPLLELRVGHAEAEQAAEALVALEDRDAVADLVELVGRGEAGGPGADDGDLCDRSAPRAGSAVTQPSLKALSIVQYSICLIITGSSSIARTQADSHGAGQIRPVNSGKLLVAWSWSIPSRQ